MGNTKILIADQIAEEGVNLLTERPLFEVINAPGLTPEQLRVRVRDCDAVIVRSATRIDAGILEAAECLRVVGRAGIGVDNIDVEAATERGIVVLNTPDANATTTAELALAHMLSLSRHLIQADRSVREGQWLRSRFLGSEITGKTVGVIGFGTIGRIVATRCLGLAMRVLAYDPFVTPEAMATIGAESMGLDALLASADYVTLHLPMNDKTRNLISADRLALMKPSARLINCARGGLVDEQGLFEALRTQRIAGAALDVYAQEPPKDSPLLALDNAVFTPHLGASTEEAQLAAGVAIANQVATFLETGETISAVNVAFIAKDKLSALRPYQELGLVLGKLLAVLTAGAPTTVELSLEGKAAELDARPILAAVLIGLLQDQLAVPINQVNARLLAKQRGIQLVERKSQTPAAYVTSVTVTGFANGVGTSLVGTLLAEDHPRLVRIDDYEIETNFDGVLVLTRHSDQPGVIGALGSHLGAAGINISRMQVGASRTHAGQAMAVLNVEMPLTSQQLQMLSELAGVRKVYQAVL
jgi:D-3-phosphoglycerate dehydrogenase / 2-oxoglutarate reductase